MSQGSQSSTQVFDFPTRFFHWVFAALFLISFTIGKTIDDESVTFHWHMISGLTLGFLVTLRILWGFLGSHYARFQNFNLKPTQLMNYFKNLKKEAPDAWAGHNPATSWVSLLMMALGLALATTGFLMTTGDREAFEDIHELFANGFILLVIGHILGLIYSGIRFKGQIVTSMVTGRKPGVEKVHVPNHGLIALVTLILVGLFGWNLIRGYDASQQTLQVFGKTLVLGEEHNHKEGHEEESH